MINLSDLILIYAVYCICWLLMERLGLLSCCIKLGFWHLPWYVSLQLVCAIPNLSLPLCLQVTRTPRLQSSLKLLHTHRASVFVEEISCFVAMQFFTKQNIYYLCQKVTLGPNSIAIYLARKLKQVILFINTRICERLHQPKRKAQ